MGMGTDLLGQDYTRAACNAVKDAIQRNFLNFSEAFNLPLNKMIWDVRVGVSKPSAVDLTKVAAECLADSVNVEAVKGGLDVKMDNNVCVMAAAIVNISYQIEIEEV